MRKFQGSVLATLTLLVMLLVAPPALAQYVSFYATGNQSPGAYPAASVSQPQAPRYASAPTYMTGPGTFGPAYQVGLASYTSAGEMPFAQGGGVYEAAAFASSRGDGAHESIGQLCEECGSTGGRGRLGYGPYEDCACGPRWFNVHVEALYLKRDEVSRLQNFASNGIGGPIVLDTNDLNFDDEFGFRATVRYDVGPSSNIEGSYFGTFHWASAAQATSGTNNHYSILSDFGIAPFGGFDDSDQTNLQRLEYSSELNSVELSWRHHWMAPTMRVQGSWLVGARYTNLAETFRYITHADAHTDPNTGNPRGPGDMNYRVLTRNNLIGFQMGGDVYACVIPGLVIGGELKAGVYGNRAEQDTNVTATSLSSPFQEEVIGKEVALVAEGGAIVVYQATPSLSLRAGFQFIYLDGVALAPENFNAAAPFPGGPVRVPTINVNGKALYYGPTAGLEWMW